MLLALAFGPAPAYVTLTFFAIEPQIMPAATFARLTDRGVVKVSGADSEKLLQGLITNDLEGLSSNTACHAALLSPQGKILFDFFVVRVGDGYLLDVVAAKAADLVKRLTMYKLRADVTIADVGLAHTVCADWGSGVPPPGATERGIRFADPRHPSMGLRILEKIPAIDKRFPGLESAHSDYDAVRVRLGVPEGGKDYDFGDSYPHEADFDIFNGVSFTKGCYVGQEVVARMQNKTVVRKRVVKISGSAPPCSGADVLIGEVAIGRVGTVAGSEALAMLRLDRAIAAAQQGQPLTSAGVTVVGDAEALERYRRSAVARAAAANPT